MSHADKYQEERDVWIDHNRRQEFEHELIERKTTWLLTTQAILFAAYGVTFRGGTTADGVEKFRDVLSWSGLAIATITLISVLAMLNSKRLSWTTYKKFFEAPTTLDLPKPHHGLEWGVHTVNTRIALLPEILLPIVFIVAWMLLTPPFR